MMRPPQPLTGFAAFQKCVEQIYHNGSIAWFKLGHNKFFTGEATPSGQFGIYATEGEGTSRRKTEFVGDAYSFLSAFAQKQTGGVFYIPGQPTDFPLKDYCFASADIGAEMDDGTTDEQWQRIEWFAAVSGLQPGLVINSASKSIHCHWFLNRETPIAEVTHLKKLMAIALLSDPAVVSPHQPMRIAGFHRLEKGKEQTLDYWSDNRYTQEQILEGLRAVFHAKEYVFPEQLSDERWQRIRKVLTDKELATEAKPDRIREILALDEAALYPQQQQRQYTPPSDFKYSGERIPLEICLSKDDRALIEQGVGEGSRANSAYKLAVDLIGTANYLDAKGVAYDSDPRQLYDDFCSRCSPPLSSREAESQWRSASRGNPTPTLSDEAIDNCIAAYLRRQNPPQKRKQERQISGDEWKGRFGFPDWIKNQLSRLPKPFRGFGAPPQSKKPPAKSINYTPGALPTPTEYVQMGSPQIIFGSGQRLGLLQEAVEKGHHDILDTSHPGTHKTTDAGNAVPNPLGVEKLWYFSQQSRNPATPTIEKNYTPLAVRNDGFVTDRERKTPMGLPYLRWAQSGEQADTPGNCFRAKEFRILATKNLPGIEGSMNPICAGCHLSKSCSLGGSPGASFRGERHATLSHSRTSAHLQSAPLPNEYDYASSGAFIDEALHNLTPMRSLTISSANYSQTMDALEQQLPSAHAALKRVRDVLSPTLHQRLKEPYYGFSNADVLEMLGDIGAIAEVIPQIIDWEHNLDDLGFLAEQPDGIDLKSVGKETKDAARYASKVLRRQSYKDTSAQLDSVAVRWLATFLQIWQSRDGDWQRGSFRIQNGELTLYWRGRRHSDLAKAMKWVCYQDATATREQLALVQDINPKTILHIQHQAPDYSNLRIIQVTGLGLLGKQRSDSAEQKVESLKRALVEKHPGIGFIDWKSPKHTQFQEGFWFADSRGTNRYANAPALASFGIPYPNLGELQALYQTLTGRRGSLDRNELDAEFQEFVDFHVQSGIVQTVGRLRAQLRSNEQLPYYFVGNYDLTFLRSALPGATIEEIKASDVTLDVCDTMERNLLGILRGLSATAAQGIKQTQAAIARFGEMTQGQVSKILAQVGGLDKLKKIFQTLLEPHIALGIISELTENEQFLAREFLKLVLQETEADGEPERLVTEVVEVIKICGIESWRKMVAVLPAEVHIALIAQIVRLFPDEWKRQLGDLLQAGGEQWLPT